MKKVGIYKITSPSGKIYIGQSRDIDNRFKYYTALRCVGQKHLYYSLVEYGVKNHRFEVIVECNENELDNLEVQYIKHYNSTNRTIGLNLQSGGSRGRDCDETKMLKQINNPKRVEFYAERDGIVQKFSSMNEAEKILHVTRGSIRISLKNPNIKKGKYSYSYTYPDTISHNKKTHILSEEARMNVRNSNRNKKPVIAIINDTRQEFNSITEASDALNVTKKVIYFALKNPTKSKCKYSFELK